MILIYAIKPNKEKKLKKHMLYKICGNIIVDSFWCLTLSFHYIKENSILEEHY